MSQFLLKKYASLLPYTPGEQPKTGGYIKLNTNESPFPPSEKAREEYLKAFDRLNLYNDPENGALGAAIAKRYGLKTGNVLLTNGSDEALAFIYMAYADAEHPFAAPEISYGFYPVFSQLTGARNVTFPLKPDCSVDADAFVKTEYNVVFANPNAQTGTFMPVEDVERIVAASPERIVAVDEAYVDFGAESSVVLIKKYPNLIVIGTFSKSRSLAGGRIGFALSSEEIVSDLKRIKYSFNPYNLGRAAEAAALGALADEEYFSECTARVKQAREYTRAEAKRLNMEVVDGKANFLLMRSELIDGGELKDRLFAEKIIVRHFSTPYLSPYIRVTIGSMDEMKTFIKVLGNILKGAVK